MTAKVIARVMAATTRVIAVAAAAAMLPALGGPFEAAASRVKGWGGVPTVCVRPAAPAAPVYVKTDGERQRQRRREGAESRKKRKRRKRGGGGWH